MNRVLINILFFSVGVSLLSHFSFAQEDPKYVPVANYRNTPELRKTVGARAISILSEHKIDWVETGSYGSTISVAANKAQEALQLLARAIKSEGLRLTLTAQKDGRYIVVTPDSVLKPSSTSGCPPPRS